ncbi:MAG: (Fe-S)-binding protein [Dehalococcoidales bacterium]|nr:MAG: (Fe-S)-binding protein [Dehalococcoidales bacterium]
MNKTELKTITGVLEQGMNRQLLYYLDVCTRCSICKDACHQYVSTGDVLFLPAYRAELIRRVYKKYFTRSGLFLPSLYEARESDDRLLDELYRSTYACTGCRRCMYYCPFSIDTTWVLGVAKAMLIAAGKGAQILTELAGAAVSKGENIDLFKDIMLDLNKETEKELQSLIGDSKATIPIEKEGADILYAALAGVHSILPPSVIFHKAGLNWTLSLFESANYGYFLGDVEKGRIIAKRIVDEAKRLGVKEVVISECGHAYRVMQYLYETWAKEELSFGVTAMVEIIARLIEEGSIEIPSGKERKIVTYHDPCQVGRNAGFYEEPRYVLNQVASNLRELNPSREKNWCCGGGGGLVAQPEFDEFRIKTGERKAEQIKQTRAGLVVSPCENCRLQITALNEKYDMGVKVTGLSDVVANQLIGRDIATSFEAGQTEEPEDED